MSEWKECSLGDVCHAQGGGTPSRQNRLFWGGHIPWASVKDFTDGKRFLWKTQEYITEQGLRSSASRLIPSGVPLVCTRMAVGRSAISLVDVAINQDVKALFPSAELTGDYLQRIIEFFEPTIGSEAIGSTVKGISTSQLLALRIAFPTNGKEQTRIAEILDTLDGAIRESEGVIGKLRQVKAGLLHDLLTRGLDENGQLRDPHRHPDHFHPSPLGLIPKAWTTRQLGNVCSAVVDCPHTTPKFQEAGVLVARTMHVKQGRFDEVSASRVSEAEYIERISRLEPQAGDVIFTREAPVGEAFVIPIGMRICLGQRVMLLRPNKDVLNPDYLVAQVYSGAVSQKIKLLTGGTTNPHLNVVEVRKLELPLPPVVEQEAIIRSLVGADARLDSEQETLAKLQQLKRGLSHDLLTGRVRV